MKELLVYLNLIHPLSPALAEHLSEVLKERKISKRDYLLKAGHICRNISFISKGLVRCFYIKGDHEVCSWFMKEGDIIISVESFFYQKKSYESIQALEDCAVFSLDYTELQTIYRQFPEFNFAGRVLTEKYYTLSEERLYSLRMQRAPERYNHLLEVHPEILLRVPAKYIASYLGITEQHFSAIKGAKAIRKVS